MLLVVSSAALILGAVTVDMPTYLSPSHVVCTADQIMRGKEGCEEVRGDIDCKGTPFNEKIQRRFHSVKLLRGRVNLDSCLGKELHAFKNLLDVEIIDPPMRGVEHFKKIPGFIVVNNTQLESINLDSLISFITSYDTVGFRIQKNGKYRMPRSQIEKLYRMTGNRNFYAQVDEELVQTKLESTIWANVLQFGGLCLAILVITGIIVYLVHFNILTNKKKSHTPLKYFENMLNGEEDEGRRSRKPEDTVKE